MATVILKLGSSGVAVANLKKNLAILGLKNLSTGNVFDAGTETAVKLFQASRGIAADGEVGPITQGEIAKALINQATKPAPKPSTISKTSVVLGWRQWFLDRLGWTEFDHDKELSQGWQYTNVPNYKTVIGSKYAWCAESLGLALIVNGYNSSHDASAISYVSYGTEVNYKKTGIPMGAIVVIEHATGGHHVTTANRDHKVGELVVEGLGGNQDNKICVETFDINPKDKGAHKILAVRWPVAAA